MGLGLNWSPVVTSLLPNSRHILILTCVFYPPLFVSTNVSDYLELGKHGFWMAADSKQLSEYIDPQALRYVRN
jgi:hypothetical protein